MFGFPERVLGANGQLRKMEVNCSAGVSPASLVLHTQFDEGRGGLEELFAGGDKIVIAIEIEFVIGIGIEAARG